MPDLGAGTGKLTALLVSLGMDVTAVEPDAAMLAGLRRFDLRLRPVRRRSEFELPMITTVIRAVRR